MSLHTQQQPMKASLVAIWVQTSIQIVTKCLSLQLKLDQSDHCSQCLHWVLRIPLTRISNLTHDQWF